MTMNDYRSFAKYVNMQSMYICDANSDYLLERWLSSHQTLKSRIRGYAGFIFRLLPNGNDEGILRVCVCVLVVFVLVVLVVGGVGWRWWWGWWGWGGMVGVGVGVARGGGRGGVGGGEGGWWWRVVGWGWWRNYFTKKRLKDTLYIIQFGYQYSLFAGLCLPITWAACISLAVSLCRKFVNGLTNQNNLVSN